MRMRPCSRRIWAGTITGKSVFRALTLAVGIALTAIGAWPQDTLEAVTDNVSYNAGAEVRLKVFLFPFEHLRSAPFDVSANLRYAGEKESLEERNVEIASHLNPGGKETATGTRLFGKFPKMQGPGATKSRSF